MLEQIIPHELVEIVMGCPLARFVTKDETSGKTLTSKSRTARLGTRSFQSMVQNQNDFRAEGNQSKERKSEKVAGLEADFDSIPLNWTLKQN